MSKLKAVVSLAVAALLVAPAYAADYIPPPTYEIPELPPVDYGLGGSFYLRGSVGGGIWTAVDASYCGCLTTFDSPGYGYSAGLGFGYETGDGIRADLTIDYLSMDGLTSTTGTTVKLRSGLVLANLYYDFALGGMGHSAEGGFGLYAGAGIGAAKNYSELSTGQWGTSVEAAGAVMAGVTYDMGSMVADLGYRGIYMNKVMDQPAGGNTYIINHNFIHELRGTVRYRFN